MVQNASSQFPCASLATPFLLDVLHIKMSLFLQVLCVTISCKLKHLLCAIVLHCIFLFTLWPLVLCKNHILLLIYSMQLLLHASLLRPLSIQENDHQNIINFVEAHKKLIKTLPYPKLYQINIVMVTINRCSLFKMLAYYFLSKNITYYACLIKSLKNLYIQ